jgi:hypothetical protein
MLLGWILRIIFSIVSKIIQIKAGMAVNEEGFNIFLENERRERDH